jgi:hypothetical protein
MAIRRSLRQGRLYVAPDGQTYLFPNEYSNLRCYGAAALTACAINTSRISLREFERKARAVNPVMLATAKLTPCRFAVTGRPGIGRGYGEA